MSKEIKRYNNWVTSGRRTTPGMSPEEKALQDYLNAGNEFIDGGAAEYNAGTPLSLEQQAAYDQLGPSSMGDITTDPRYKNYEMEALRQLEEQSQKGFTARDEADMARVEQQANRANRGRQGAIQQNMQSRGLSGSGLDFAMQQQAAQDSTEMEALAGLEKNAQMAERKQSAAQRLGSLGGQLQDRDFGQAARKAEAADEIARFNTANSIQRQQANTQIANQQSIQNWDRSNVTGDRNTAAQYGYRKDKMGTQQDGASVQLEKSNQDYNRRQAEKAAKARKRAGMGAAVGGVIGGAAGAYFGGPAGAAAGYQAGSGLGSNFAKGGRIPGASPFPGDDEMNDIFAAQLSPGEIVLPRTVADDPNESAAFVAATNQGLDPMSAKYIAQAAAEKANDTAPFYPTADGKAIKSPSVPKASAPKAKQAASAQPVISEPALAMLKETRPDLVAAYRQKMAEADAGVADAEKMQGYMGMANLVGKAATDFANSQKDPIIQKNNFLAGRNQKLDIIEPAQTQYDGSMLDKLGAQQVASAQSKRQDVRQGFDDEQKLQAVDQSQKLKDPNSDESKSARAFLKSVLPSAAKIQGIEGMSAAQLEKASPMLMQKWQADRAQANADRSYNLQAAKLYSKGQPEPKANQSTAANYGKRLLQAEKEMVSIAGTGYDRSDVSSGVGSNMPNILRSDAGVRQDQAERNFINAVLRRESGAAISPTEFGSAEAQYFPRVGDGPETLKQKERNRAQVLESFKAESGPAWQQTPEVNAGPSEVRRKTKDGKTAIFNAETKEFIRYED